MIFITGSEHRTTVLRCTTRVHSSLKGLNACVVCIRDATKKRYVIPSCTDFFLCVSSEQTNEQPMSMNEWHTFLKKKKDRTLTDELRQIQNYCKKENHYMSRSSCEYRAEKEKAKGTVAKPATRVPKNKSQPAIPQPQPPSPLQVPSIQRLVDFSELKMTKGIARPMVLRNGSWQSYWNTSSSGQIYAILPGLNRISHLRRITFSKDGVDVHIQRTWNDKYDKYACDNPSGYNLRNLAELVKDEIFSMIDQGKWPSCNCMRFAWWTGNNVGTYKVLARACI